MSSVRSVSKSKRLATARQSRQNHAVAVDAMRVITDRKTLARAAAMVRELTDKERPGALSLRDLASRTWRGRNQYGFWQHVMNHSKSVKLRWIDYKQLQSISDLREAGVYANASLARLVIQFQEHMALAQLDMVEIARVVADSQRVT